MVRVAVVLGILLVAVAGMLAYLATRPASQATLDDPAGAVVECAAATGLDAAGCRAWGLAAVADGAPSNTFELTDLGRLRLDRDLFGLASSCRAEWFTTRYPNEAAWSEAVSCPTT